MDGDTTVVSAVSPDPLNDVIFIPCRALDA
jgi:hypothetical protein